MVGKADSTGKNAANSKNWFSYGNQLDTKKVSSSFRGANAFKNYFLVAAKRKKYFSSNVSNEELYNYVKIGDAVSFCRIEGSNKIAKHTMIVINKKPKTNEVILAAHTSSTNDTILCSKLKSYAGCYIFGMK